MQAGAVSQAVPLSDAAARAGRGATRDAARWLAALDAAQAPMPGASGAEISPQTQTRAGAREGEAESAAAKGTDAPRAEHDATLHVAAERGMVPASTAQTGADADPTITAAQSSAQAGVERAAVKRSIAAQQSAEAPAGTIKDKGKDKDKDKDKDQNGQAAVAAVPVISAAPVNAPQPAAPGQDGLDAAAAGAGATGRGAAAGAGISAADGAVQGGRAQPETVPETNTQPAAPPPASTAPGAVEAAVQKAMQGTVQEAMQGVTQKAAGPGTGTSGPSGNAAGGGAAGHGTATHGAAAPAGDAAMPAPVPAGTAAPASMAPGAGGTAAITAGAAGTGAAGESAAEERAAGAAGAHAAGVHAAPRSAAGGARTQASGAVTDSAALTKRVTGGFGMNGAAGSGAALKDGKDETGPDNISVQDAGATSAALASAAPVSGAAPDAMAVAAPPPATAAAPAGPAVQPSAAGLAAAVTALHQSGQSGAVLRLDPAGLGPLSVHVSLAAGGQVNVLFVPATAAAGTALQANLGGLGTALAQSGLTLGQAQVGGQFSGQFSGQSGQHSGQGAYQPGLKYAARGGDEPGGVSGASGASGAAGASGVNAYA